MSEAVSGLRGTDTVRFAQATVAVMSSYYVTDASGNLYRITSHDQRTVRPVPRDKQQDWKLALARTLKPELLKHGLAPCGALITRMLDFFMHNADPVHIVPTGGTRPLGPNDWCLRFEPFHVLPAPEAPEPVIELGDRRQDDLFTADRPRQRAHAGNDDTQFQSQEHAAAD